MRKLIVILLSGVVCLLGVSLAFAQESGVYSTLADYEKITGGKIEKFNESPMFRTKVAAGELPSIEQRLPEEPLVLKPFKEIGKYGGTLHSGMVSASQYSPAAQNTMEYMLMMDRKFEKIIPNIAKGWKFSNNGKTFALHLRKGMKWSDGAPFSADDIMFWWEDVVLNDDLTPVKPREWISGGKLMKVKKIDDYTVEFNFTKPYWAVIYSFASVNFRGGQNYCFLPKHALKKYHAKYNKKADELAKEAGYEYWWQLFNSKKDFSISRQQWPDIPAVGPWVTKKVLPDGVIFERNPYYFKIDTAGNQLPYIDKVRGTFFGDSQTHLMKMVAGQIDFEAWGTGVTDYPVLVENAKKGGYRVWLGKDLWGGAAVYFFNQNYTEDPIIGNLLRNVKFRQALSLAIDREEVKEVVGLGHGVPRQATVYPACSFYEDWWGKSYAQYDPDKTNEILDEIGLSKKDKDGYRLRPDGKRLTITITLVTDMPYWPNVSELVKEYWENVGVKTVLNVIAREYFWTFIGAAKSQVHVWVQDQTSEGAFIASQAAFFKGGLSWAPEWLTWWNSNGKEGKEPPKEIKHIWSLCESLPFLSEEERNKAAKEICSFEAKNLFFVGTVGMMGKPCIANVNLGNVNTNAFADNCDNAGNRNNWLEEWFWKK